MSRCCYNIDWHIDFDVLLYSNILIEPRTRLDGGVDARTLCYKLSTDLDHQSCTLSCTSARDFNLRI
eukprot:m.96343 g.96343  ORF g.96343 m.96343 type:complete len:67 (+) comp12361_c0_seq4:1470-1670(+)